MEETSESRMTLKQALVGKWQIPLFLAAVVALVSLLICFRPSRQAKTFDENYNELVVLVKDSRYQEFYSRVEPLRLDSETEEELGRVHGLVGKARAQQLRHRMELGVDSNGQRSAPANYEAIVRDYEEALSRDWPGDNPKASVEVYHDMGLSRWCLNDAEESIELLGKALEVSGGVEPEIRRDLVKMYLASQPEAYLDKSLVLLDAILDEPHSSLDDRAWAFVRKAEVMISQGDEEKALAMLSASNEEFEQSQYSNEMEFMRGRALRHAGETDLADLVLRDLLKKIKDRGDIYAQTLLELGKINYSQFRDHDAKKFYSNVVTTQLGKHWHAGGLFGLAQCAAMQERYEDSLGYYRDVVSFLRKNPFNRVVSADDVQESLTLLTRQLGLRKEYDLALRFMGIQNDIAQDADIRVVERFARMNEWRANQLVEQYEDSQEDVLGQSPSETDLLWAQQQKRFILLHYEQAAHAYLQVAKLGFKNDEVYGRNLWQGAINFDKAGNAEKTIETWQRIVTEREGKPQWPLALYRLAQSYQSVGDYDPAIEYYVLLQQRHSKSPDVFKSMVALAKCYLAKEEPQREKAQALLQGVLTNLAVTPKAAVYRNALFELGELYYDHQEYSKSIEAFSEAIDRYPNEAGIGKLLYMTADAYRQSGLALDQTLEQLSEDATMLVNQEKTQRLRQEYLEQAYSSFTRAIQFFEDRSQDRLSRLDETNLRYCWLYRATCLFDLGLYRQAEEAYEEVALRYQLTSTALGAFMQVVNCQVMQGDTLAAKSTQKRAIWQLRQMPEAAFATGEMNFTTEQWGNWFEWLDTSRLW